MNLVTKDRSVILSTLWIFATLNYLYCDVLSLMSPEMLRSLIETGGVGGMDMNDTTLLGAAILLEIPISLVLLSRVLRHKANRWANVIGGLLMTAVMGGTLVMGDPGYHYVFFAIIEIATTVFIVWFAWTWTNSEVRQVEQGAASI